MADVQGVVADGDLARSLTELRASLAESIDEATPAQKPALVKQMVAVLERLEQIQTPERSKVDELAKRRRARRKPGADTSAEVARGK